jgi:hypothetical protein
VKEVALATAIRGAEARYYLPHLGQLPAEGALQPLSGDNGLGAHHLGRLQEIINMPVEPFIGAPVPGQSLIQVVEGGTHVAVEARREVLLGPAAYGQPAALVQPQNQAIGSPVHNYFSPSLAIYR